MRNLILYISCILLLFGCIEQNGINERYLDKIALIDDISIRFQQYSEFPFNQEWFKSKKTIEEKLGKPIKIEEFEGITQWNEKSKYYILKYKNMDIYGYITTNREEIYRIDLCENIWGELRYGKIGATRKEWELEFGESQEAGNSERVVYGGSDFPAVIVYFDKKGKAVKIIRWISG